MPNKIGSWTEIGAIVVLEAVVLGQPKEMHDLTLKTMSIKLVYHVQADQVSTGDFQ